MRTKDPSRPGVRRPPTAARQTMRGIRRWLTSAALLSGTTAALGQGPMLPVPPTVTEAEPPIATALPGGTVVGSHGSVPIATTPVLAPEAAPGPIPAGPAAAAPIVTPPVPVTGTPAPIGLSAPV